MTNVTITREEIDSVVAKLDRLDVTANEKRLVHAAIRLAVDTSPPRVAEREAVDAPRDNGIDVGSF